MRKGREGHVREVEEGGVLIGGEVGHGNGCLYLRVMEPPWSIQVTKIGIN